MEVFGSCIQIISMRVLTDQKCELQVRKMLEQAFVPARRTLGTRWIITAILSSPGITKSHRKNRNLSLHRRRSNDPAPASHAGDRRLHHSKVYRSDGPCSLAPDRRSKAERCSPAAQRVGDRAAVPPHRSDKHELRATCVSATFRSSLINKYRSRPRRILPVNDVASLIDIAISQAQEPMNSGSRLLRLLRRT